MLPIIGIIAGQGLLPFLIADKYMKQGGRCYIAAIDGECDAAKIKNFNYQIFKIGMAGSIISYLRKNQVQEIIFAGSINRPNLGNLAVDKIGSILLLKVIKQKILGDDKLLRIIANYFEENGFKVISSDKILKNQNLSTAMITNALPLEQDVKDIEFGLEVLSALSKMDVGQAVIIENGYVLGIEAAEGTDNLIARCAKLRKNIKGGVLVKTMKSTQDNRLDIPAIGPDTILNLAKYNYNGIAIEEDNVIIINQELTIKLANEHEIFIIRKNVSNRHHR